MIHLLLKSFCQTYSILVPNCNLSIFFNVSVQLYYHRCDRDDDYLFLSCFTYSFETFFGIDILLFLSGLSGESTELEKEALHAGKANLDSDNEKKVGRSTFFDSLEWSGNVSSGPRPQNGPKRPMNKENLTNFAAMHEHARPVIANLSGSESEGSEQDLRELKDAKENVATPENTAPLIDIGLSFDDVQITEQETKPANNSKSNELFSNYFDDDFANLRSNGNDSNVPRTEQQNKGGQNIFNDDFSALKIETNLDTKREVKVSSSTSNAQNSTSSDNNNFGLLLNLENAETSNGENSFGDKNMSKSPSTPNFPSSAVRNPLIDISEPSLEGKTTRSPSLKKNRSTTDLSDKHGEDDFFQALSDRHTPTSEVSSAHNSFSIASENVVDPFSVKDDPHTFFDAFSPTSSSSSTTMKHSSSDGDLLGDWGHSHAEPTLKPTSAASSTSGGIHRSASSASEIGSTQTQKKNDPFDFVNLSSGNYTKPGLNAAQRPSSTANMAQNPSSSSGGFYFASTQQQRSGSPFGSSGSFTDSRNHNTSQFGASQQPKASMPKKTAATTTQSAPNYYVGKAFSGNSVFGNSQRGGLGGGWGTQSLFFTCCYLEIYI